MLYFYLCLFWFFVFFFIDFFVLGDYYKHKFSIQGEKMDNKVTKFTTILLLILKECRLERNVHQAVIADFMGKSANAITKIETASTSLQMDVFLSYCKALSISPAAVMATAERYMALFASLGWNVVGSSVSDDEDELLLHAQKYYLSSLYKKRPVLGWVSLSGPIYTYGVNGQTQVNGLDVFLSALYPEIKPLEEPLKIE